VVDLPPWIRTRFDANVICSAVGEIGGNRDLSRVQLPRNLADVDVAVAVAVAVAFLGLRKLARYYSRRQRSESTRLRTSRSIALFFSAPRPSSRAC
jgi:hypothetical protein